jgi:hypothetical protein
VSLNLAGNSIFALFNLSFCFISIVDEEKEEDVSMSDGAFMF